MTREVVVAASSESSDHGAVCDMRYRLRARTLHPLLLRFALRTTDSLLTLQTRSVLFLSETVCKLFSGCATESMTAPVCGIYRTLLRFKLTSPKSARRKSRTFRLYLALMVLPSPILRDVSLSLSSAILLQMWKPAPEPKNQSSMLCIHDWASR